MSSFSKHHQQQRRDAKISTPLFSRATNDKSQNYNIQSPPPKAVQQQKQARAGGRHHPFIPGATTSAKPAIMYRSPYPYPNTVVMTHHPPGGGAPIPVLVPVVATTASTAQQHAHHLALFASPKTAPIDKQEYKKMKKQAKKEAKKEKKRQKKLKKQMKKEAKRAKKASRSSSKRGENGGDRVSGVRTKFLLESARQEYYTVQEENATLRKIIETKLPNVATTIFEECCPPRQKVSSIDELVDLMPTRLKIDVDDGETIGEVDDDETLCDDVDDDDES